MRNWAFETSQPPEGVFAFSQAAMPTSRLGDGASEQPMHDRASSLTCVVIGLKIVVQTRLLRCGRKTMHPTFDNTTAWQTKLMWAAVAVLGAVAFAVVALNRGEPANAAWLVVSLSETQTRTYW